MMHVNQVKLSFDRQNSGPGETPVSPLIDFQARSNDWEDNQSAWRIEDIPEEAIEDLRFRINQAGHMHFDCSERELMLRKSFLADQEWLKNAGAVLLCETPYAEMSLNVCDGEDRSALVLQQRTQGNLFDNIAAAEKWIADQTEGYPMTAVHEILCNAFCHRDYRSSQCNDVVIYEDELEFFNPGELPSGYDFDDFCMKAQRPVPRNPLIARILYYTGDIKGMGTGLKMVQQVCQTTGIQAFFRQDKGGTVVVLKGGHRKSPRQNEWGVDLTDNEQKILDYLQTHAYITNASAREVVAIGTTATRNLLNGLVDKGILMAEGANRGRKYFLTALPF